MSALLDIQNVTRRYPRPRQRLLHRPEPLVALDNASLTLNAGETYGIVGESGSGKTTLARLVMGFEAPDNGRVLLGGEDLHALPEHILRQRRQTFQMVFQDPFGSLDPRRPVGWSVGQPLRATGQQPAPAQIAQTFERVGLSASDAERYPHEFSGGQRQRIAIARAIITKPRLLVADEAVSALDVSVRAQILNLLLDLQDEFGLAMLFVTHDLAVVANLCDHLLVLRNGRTVEQGPAQAILTNPQTDYTTMLLDAARVTPAGHSAPARTTT
ncbi:ABC transporter ATP-binding protein [Aliishimia ponticola]|uniref:ABC transporter ATP-binding protein n=1 Tax=Aliishimia ponticola TaxID=2499833 RepID=A0A4S4NEY0_9RHOB|nr:ABC transporter ATP-binding protein [Aliishimia ponticola]THH36698.1 ABC transporter ATP-binding protein [Aliishimia ponticola]